MRFHSTTQTVSFVGPTGKRAEVGGAALPPRLQLRSYETGFLRVECGNLFLDSVLTQNINTDHAR